ncbi:hypothetical protein ACFL4T_02090 [candidate division KSB1 bacterium]
MGCNHKKVTLIAYFNNEKKDEPYKMFTCRICNKTLVAQNGDKPRVKPTSFWRNI